MQKVPLSSKKENMNVQVQAVRFRVLARRLVGWPCMCVELVLSFLVKLDRLLRIFRSIYPASVEWCTWMIKESGIDGLNLSLIVKNLCSFLNMLEFHFETSLLIGGVWNLDCPTINSLEWGIPIDDSGSTWIQWNKSFAASRSDPQNPTGRMYNKESPKCCSFCRQFWRVKQNIDVHSEPVFFSVSWPFQVRWPWNLEAKEKSPKIMAIATTCRFLFQIFWVLGWWN